MKNDADSRSVVRRKEGCISTLHLPALVSMYTYWDRFEISFRTPKTLRSYAVLLFCNAILDVSSAIVCAMGCVRWENCRNNEEKAYSGYYTITKVPYILRLLDLVQSWAKSYADFVMVWLRLVIFSITYKLSPAHNLGASFPGDSSSLLRISSLPARRWYAQKHAILHHPWRLDYYVLFLFYHSYSLPWVLFRTCCLLLSPRRLSFISKWLPQRQELSASCIWKPTSLLVTQFLFIQNLKFKIFFFSLSSTIWAVPTGMVELKSTWMRGRFVCESKKNSRNRRQRSSANYAGSRLHEEAQSVRFQTCWFCIFEKKTPDCVIYNQSKERESIMKWERQTNSDIQLSPDGFCEGRNTKALYLAMSSEVKGASGGYYT